MIIFKALSIFWLLMCIIGLVRSSNKKLYWSRLLETHSQWFNVCHSDGGRPNTTFSARIAVEDDHWYWRFSRWWVTLFMGKNHLDEAIGDDLENE